jgi:preprotein translocase subunit SecG
MLKRITLLLAMLFAVGSISTSVLAQDEEESEAESTTTTETSTEGDGGDPECD